MEATTRWRSSKEAFCFDEHFDGAMGVDMAGFADTLHWDDEEGRYEAVVVETSEIPRPETPVGVVEGFEDAVAVDERVEDEFV